MILFLQELLLTTNFFLCFFACSDHILLAEIITQAPMTVPGLNEIRKGMSMDEYMRKQAKERFGKVIIALRAMPSSLMLVIR